MAVLGSLLAVLRRGLLPVLGSVRSLLAVLRRGRLAVLRSVGFGLLAVLRRRRLGPLLFRSGIARV
ncbi:hypothetical protein ACIQTZ_16255 [Paenarthrobacter sp. NPDC090520]|uniref:hypothetical protein n=1 Tax=Paenarthrobacter sp. NPDC090520 TaxID=3364382 RepID=UPI0038289D0A